MLERGSILSDRYEVLEKIGSGGMAIVFRGKDKKLERYVTIKVLRDEYIGDDEFIKRFNTEACSAARLSHPNIVRVYDVGEEDGIYYIVMEYIHGDTLKQAIKEKAPFDTKSTINVAIQMASALAQAHKNHIVHRDIKPQNILVGADGIIKVTDFGIARAATASTMTTAANALGSVHYFSPEQARGGYIDEKSDIYSLGITMYEMATGKLPFEGTTSVSIALKQINDELPDMRIYNPDVTKSLEGIIKKATKKKSDERYQTIDALLHDLILARTDETGEFIKTLPIGMIKEQEGYKEKIKKDINSDIKENAKENIKDNTKENIKEDIKEDIDEDINEDINEDIKKDIKKDIKEDIKDESKEPEISFLSNQKLKPILPINVEKNVDEPSDIKVRPELPETGVGFDKYSKKLRISKEDEYENEYEEVKPLNKSKEPSNSGGKRRNPRFQEDYDGVKDKSAERKVIIAAVVTALIIIAGITFVGAKMMGGFGGGKKADITVPSFLGQEYEAANIYAEELGLKLEKEGSDYSKYYEKGMIISQTLEETAMVSKGTKIGVKISLGLSGEPMPNIVGKSEKTAVADILELVGAEVAVDYEFNDTVEVGIVISQSPTEGVEIDASSSISLTVSKGEENKKVSVPNVEGLSEAQAKKDLSSMGLVVGSVTSTDSTKHAKGIVITQTVSAGTEVAKNSVVGLVISSGAPITEVPEEVIPIPETPVPEQTPETPETTPPVAPVTPPPTAETSSTRMFGVSAPATIGETATVKVVKVGADGTTQTIMEETKNKADFPFVVGVTGTGKATVECYIDGTKQWSENANFSEGGN